MEHGLKKENMILITDGNLHLRQYLIPDCVNQNIEIPYYYYCYYDIRKNFRMFSNNYGIESLGQILNCKLLV